MYFDTRIYTTSLILITSLFFNELFAQTEKSNLNQDLRFEKLLNEKRKLNSSLSLTDRYKIQIFNGDNESAKKTLQNFKRDFKFYDATIIFNTPTYKVVVGNFKTRIESEKNLMEIRKVYKNALLIRPKN